MARRSIFFNNQMFFFDKSQAMSKMIRKILIIQSAI